jgi:hypothetical protein
MRISMKQYADHCDQEEYPLIKQVEYAKLKGISRFSVWRSMSLGKLDFVHIDLYIPKDDEWKFVRYIIYNNRARNLKYRKTTYGLTKEELNK